MTRPTSAERRRGGRRAALRCLLLAPLLAVAAPEPGRIERISQGYLGVPYQLDPLGEGADADIDRDPLLRVDRFDCQTFVETVLAEALSPAPTAVAAILQQWRYRDGQIGFATRNHFPEADWIANNAARGALVDLDAEVAGAHPLAQVSVRVGRRAWLRARAEHPAGRPDERAPPDPTARARLAALAAAATDTRLQWHYIPSGALEDRALIARIPSGAIVFIVRRRPGGATEPAQAPLISHMGFAIRQADQLLLRHASAIGARAVVEEPLRHYLARRAAEASFAGIAVYAAR